MKRRYFVFILAVFLFNLNGCSQERLDYSDSYVSGQDSQYGFINKASRAGCIAEAPAGYYFLSGTTNRYLYFYDNKKKQAIPVCNKPNCLHADEPDSYKIPNCNAFLGEVESLYYYNEELYYIINELDKKNGSMYDALYEISSDGTNRKLILKAIGLFGYLEFHRGYIYYSMDDAGTIAGQEATTKTKYMLCRYQLDKADAKPEILDQGEEIYGQFCRIFCFGNDIYYTGLYYKGSSLEQRIMYTKRFDFQTKEIKSVLDTGALSLTVFNGKLVYSLVQGTFESDLDGKNSIKISDCCGPCCSNDNYLFLDNKWGTAEEPNNRALTVLDKNSNIIKTISLSEFSCPRDVPLGCSNEYYFIPDYGKSNEFGEINTLYCIPVNKNADDMTLKVFYSFVPKVENHGYNQEPK